MKRLKSRVEDTTLYLNTRWYNPNEREEFVVDDIVQDNYCEKIVKRNKTAYFEGPKEFTENYLKQSYYPDERKELIEEAYKRGFGLDALRLLGNTSFDEKQARQLYEGLLQLPLDKVKLYANKNLYYLQMEIIKDALINHMPQDKLNLLLQDIDYAQSKEINQGIKDGLDMEKLKSFSDPNLNWKEMHIRRNSKKASRRNSIMKRLNKSITSSNKSLSEDPYGIYKYDLNWHDDGNDAPDTPGYHVEDPSMADYIKGYKLDPYSMRYWAKVAKADKNPRGLMKIAWKEVDVLQFTPEYLADKILKLWNTMDGTLQNAFEGFTLRYDNHLKTEIANEINKRGYEVYPILLVDAPMYGGVSPQFTKFSSVNKAKQLKKILSKNLKTIISVQLDKDLDYILKTNNDTYDVNKKAEIMFDYYSQLFPEDYTLNLIKKQYFKPFVDIQISDVALDQMEKMDSENQESLVLKDNSFDAYDFVSDMRYDTTEPNVYEVNNGTDAVYKLSSRLKKKIVQADDDFSEDGIDDIDNDLQLDDLEDDNTPVPTFSMPDVENTNTEEETVEENEIEYDVNNKLPQDLVFDTLKEATNEIASFTGQKMLKPPVPVAIYIREDKSLTPDSYSFESEVAVADYLDMVYTIYQFFLKNRTNVFAIIQADRYTQDHKFYEWDNVLYKGFYNTKQEAVNYIKGHL